MRNSQDLQLVVQLCREMEKEGINYCHWKSNNALDRSANGENDLDLLVSRADSSRFGQLLFRFGFKSVKVPREKEMPGVVDYYGYDTSSNKIVHAHAHYQLVVGHNMTKNYRIPIEKAYLGSSVQGELFKVPAYEFEFVIFVIRMILKYFTWDAIFGHQGRWKDSEREEFNFLQRHINEERVNDVVSNHLPYLDEELFRDCVQALTEIPSILARIIIGHQLMVKLRANARRSTFKDVLMKMWRRGVMMIRRRVFRSQLKNKLGNGGTMIAVVGGDGAGKSTAIEGLYDWLSKDFEVAKMHIGKPEWSKTTIFIRGILKIGQMIGLYPFIGSLEEVIEIKSLVPPGYPWLVRAVSTARDRYWCYVRARRFAAKGGVVIIDRFPLSQIKTMDGRQGKRYIGQLTQSGKARNVTRRRRFGGFTQLLVSMEENYYDQIVMPELVFVLMVDPEIAVERKTDESPDSVRMRSAEVWNIDWSETGVEVIDANQSKEDVLSELKTIIWSKL